MVSVSIYQTTAKVVVIYWKVWDMSMMYMVKIKEWITSWCWLG